MNKAMEQALRLAKLNHVTQKANAEWLKKNSC